MAGVVGGCGLLALGAVVDRALQEALANVTAAAAPHIPGASYWSNMGHVGQLEENVAAWRALAVELATRSGGGGGDVVCEVGFNAGHSAVIWLHRTAHTLQAFDLLRLPHSRASRAYVERSYPARATFRQGDSKDTFRRYAHAVGRGCASACGLVSIDGQHSLLGALYDLVSAIHAAREASSGSSILVMDDATRRCPGVLAVWTAAVEGGFVTKRNCTSMKRPHTGLKGWCIGEIRRPGAAVAWEETFSQLAALVSSHGERVKAPRPLRGAPLDPCASRA